jgi:hypothetical protein
MHMARSRLVSLVSRTLHIVRVGTDHDWLCRYMVGLSLFSRTRGGRLIQNQISLWSWSWLWRPWTADSQSRWTLEWDGWPGLAGHCVGQTTPTTTSVGRRRRGVPLASHSLQSRVRPRRAAFFIASYLRNSHRRIPYRNRNGVPPPPHCLQS